MVVYGHSCSLLNGTLQNYVWLDLSYTTKNTGARTRCRGFDTPLNHNLPTRLKLKTLGQNTSCFTSDNKMTNSVLYLALSPIYILTSLWGQWPYVRILIHYTHDWSSTATAVDHLNRNFGNIRNARKMRPM